MAAAAPAPVEHLQPCKWRPRALDIFCGAGGATKGLQMAGFHVTGVDLKPQPRYCGDAFVQDDAMTFPLGGFDFIWASPPCQGFTDLKAMWNRREHPDLLTPTRERLKIANIPYTIENVEGAPMFPPVLILCGTMFHLRTADGRAELRRHRIFECSFPVGLTPPCAHNGRMVIGVYGGHGRDRRRVVQVVGHSGGRSVRDGCQQFSVQQRREAMGISWMNGAELSQAIPPAYSHFIGKQALEHLSR